jgi:tetratricopeptide (TPR) repeat protein
MFYNPKEFKKSGAIKIIKHGYNPVESKISFVDLSKKKITKQFHLERESAFIRIASKPSGARVLVNGEFIGKTPLANPYPVPSGFVKLELIGVSGYKAFKEVVELERGTLDLSGVRSIQLESDYLLMADKLLKSGKVSQALKKLNDVPVGHSDYLQAQHKSGEIYLTILKKPADAAASFAKVTSNPEVKNFNDKRFVGSHIDEGIALFLTGQSLLSGDKPSAIAHLQKAIEVLEHASPYLRFISKKEYAKAAHSVSYYKAMSYHRLWQLSHSKGDLIVAVRNWRNYLDSVGKNQNLQSEEKSLLKNARVYYKQAKASMKSVRK